MSVIVLLIAAGGLVAGGFLLAFIWAVRAGQFDDVGTPPVRMLVDDLDAPVRPHPHPRGTVHVESRL
jgi:cbb3-type cytochrome oxidase maturation protein